MPTLSLLVAGLTLAPTPPIQDAKAVADARLSARGQPTSGPRGLVGPGVPAFWVRPGYRVDLAARVPGARFLEFGAKQRLYVSRLGNGDILTLEPMRDGSYRQVGTLVTGYPNVHGMHWADGWLWFATPTAIYRARDNTGSGRASQIVKVVDGLPSGGGHNLRTILVTTRGFFTSIGDSGNATDETATDRQKIWLYALDGKTRKLWASGLRNTEKLRLRPGTEEVWGADHGSDNWGQGFGEVAGRQPFTDLIPPDEFNRYDEGGFYGHPFVIGDRIPREEFRTRSDILTLAERTTPPEWKFGAHWAANGFTFVTGDLFGSEGSGDAVQALHGSWNSTIRAGYRLERVMFDPATGRPGGSAILVGTLVNGSPAARPVDVAQDSFGNLLFTDDQGGAIYRFSRVR